MTTTPPRAFYTGLVADLYAPLKSTVFAMEPYRDLIQRWGQPALELGCGDGDPLLDLRAAGLDVDGIDSSPDMIERLERRAAARDLQVTAWVDSMEDLRTERPYRTIFLAGPTFNLLPDDETMAQALRAVRRALATEGAAVIPLFEPEPVYDEAPGVMARQDTPDGSITCTMVRAVRDTDARTQTLTLRYERVAGEATDTVERDWLLHWVEIGRFTELAVDAGLQVIASPEQIGEEPADVVLTHR